MQIWRTLAHGRTRGQSSRAHVGTLVAVAVLGFASSASAQDAIGKEFSAQRFDPAPGPRNFFSTRGARTDGEMAWSAGLNVNYANTPLKVDTCISDTPGTCPDPTQTRRLKVIENLVQADVLGSFTPIPRLQIGLRIPVGYAKGNGIDEFAEAKPVSKAGMPDPELEVKGRVYGEIKDPLVLGVAVYGTAPTGHATAPGAYMGDETPGVGGRVILDGNAGPLAYGVNLGGIFRGEGRMDQAKVGSEMRYSAAVAYQPSPLLRVLVDAFGSTRFTSTAGENALEIDGGAQITPLGSHLMFQAGAGFGAISGFGVPAVRALIGGAYVFEKRDRDNDGIDDALDQCPTEPEDRDGNEDSDGCPDPDNDLDTIPDAQDKCPNQAEDMDGFEDTDGCPDPDNDKDGIPDDKDECVDEPENFNHFEDEDGCPDDPKQKTQHPKKEKKAAPAQPEPGKVLEL